MDQRRRREAHLRQGLRVGCRQPSHACRQRGDARAPGADRVLRNRVVPPPRYEPNRARSCAPSAVPSRGPVWWRCPSACRSDPSSPRPVARPKIRKPCSWAATTARGSAATSSPTRCWPTPTCGHSVWVSVAARSSCWRVVVRARRDGAGARVARASRPGSAARACTGSRRSPTGCACSRSGTPTAARSTACTGGATRSKGRGACSFPDGAVRLLRSALHAFAADAQLHARGHVCAGGQRPPVLAVPRRTHDIEWR